MKGPSDGDPAGDATTLPVDPAPAARTSATDVPVRSSAPALLAGALLVGRWRVVRFVARGAMGEVYEAEDTELGVRVALKVVRAEIADQDQTIDRFKREIQLARQVTHRAVCRIFDLGSDAGRTFLTMELLGGETLAARLSRGAMTVEQAAPIAAELCAGLAAAHAAGVIHRDLKSANVVLVPGDSGERAVITDFGLARAQTGDVRITASADTGLLGTPAYMAPEQVEGGVTGRTADIYALGVVLFEMVTGRLPFVEATPLATAVARLQRDPPSPRGLVPGLDARWEDAILRCLARDPEARFQSAADVARALEPSSPRAPSRASLVGLAVALVAVVAGVTAWRWRDPTPPATVAAPPDSSARRSVAVLGFRNLVGSAELAWLSTALAEMLDTDLGAGGALRVIPGEDVARAKHELGLADADGYAKDTLAHIRDNLGVDYVVVGSYMVVGGNGSAARSLRFDIKLQDTSSGELVDSQATTGGEDRLLELAGAASAQLRTRLGVAATPVPALTATATGLPSTPDGQRSFSEGLVALRAGDFLKARDLLNEARAVAPSSPLVESALAEVWWELGDSDRARKASQHAVELANDLPARDHQLVDARAKLYARDLPGAAKELDALFEASPDDLELGLMLIDAEDGSDTLATCKQLHALPPPAGDDPRIDLGEAIAYDALDDQPDALAAIRRAETGARSRGATLLLAGARMYEARALAETGDDGALAAANDATAIYARLGVQAQDAQLGDARALAFSFAGDDDRARAEFRRSAAEYDAIGNSTAANDELLEVVYDAIDVGDVAGARAAIAALARHDPDGAALAEDLEPRLAYITGDPTTAKPYFVELVADAPGGREHGQAARRLGNVLRSLGDTVGARQQYAAALASQVAAHASFWYVDAAKDLVWLDAIDGHRTDPAVARELEGLAAPAAHTNPLVRFLAHLELAWIDQAAGKLVEARAQVDQALALYRPETNSVYNAFLVAAVALAVDDADGVAPAADVERMERVRELAVHYENPEMILEARLALAVHAHHAGRDVAGELAAIAAEAGTHALAWLAHRAAAVSAVAIPATHATRPPDTLAPRP